MTFFKFFVRTRLPASLFSAGQFVHVVPPKGAHYMRAHYLHVHRQHWSKDKREWLYDGQVGVIVGTGLLNHFRWRQPIHDVPEHRLAAITGDTWK